MGCTAGNLRLAAGGSQPKVNTHTGDNPVSIYRVFMGRCGLRPSRCQGSLVYWMYDYID